MGNSSKKAKQVKEEYRRGLKTEKHKYSKLEKRHVLLVGPPCKAIIFKFYCLESGKTQFLNHMLDHDF